MENSIREINYWNWGSRKGETCWKSRKKSTTKPNQKHNQKKLKTSTDTRKHSDLVLPPKPGPSYILIEDLFEFTDADTYSEENSRDIIRLRL